MWCDSVEGVPVDVLADYFGRDDPIGPTDAARVSDRRVLTLLTEQELASLRSSIQRPSIIVGRRGSGKTSYLGKLRLKSRPDLFLQIKTERTLSLCTAINRLSQQEHHLELVESVASVWDGIFWNCLFWILHRAGRPRHGFTTMREHLRSMELEGCNDLDEVLSAYRRMFERIAKESGSFAMDRVIERLRGKHFDLLRSSAVRDLKNNQETALVVLDSVEEYPLGVDAFKLSLKGLLKSAGGFNAIAQNFDVRLCLPAELYRDFADDISSNSTKDFSKLAIVRWQVTELLIASCRRILICLRLYYPDAYQRLKSNPLETRRDADSFMAELFPMHTANADGMHERTDLYLLRHTQLLPRQLFMLLGSIFSRVLSGPSPAGNEKFVPEAAIREGIEQREEFLVDEIFSVFKHRFPESKDLCLSVLPSLPRVFSMDELKAAVAEVGKQSSRSLSADNIRSMLFEMGALGKVDRTDSTYTWGKFIYTQTDKIPIGTNDRICVHPLFSRRFASIRSGPTERPIMPLSGGV